MARIKYYNPNTGRWEYADSQYTTGGNVDLTGVVKSVNGKTPDEDGNVYLYIPEDPGDSTLYVKIDADNTSDLGYYDIYSAAIIKEKIVFTYYKEVLFLFGSYDFIKQTVYFYPEDTSIGYRLALKDKAVTEEPIEGSVEDGFSPIVTVERTEDGAVISITDKTGTTTATITNGKDGKDGADGQPGKDGVDGKDYVLTDGDRAEIAAMVIEMLGGEPVFGYVDENGNIIVHGNLPDGTYSVKYEIEDGSTIDIGDLVLDSNVYYSVTNQLTNCTNSNGASEVIGGQSYSAVITANSGYELSSVTVTMGGESVAVSGGNISIAEVTGDIVITAVAEEATVEIINQIPISIDSSGAVFNGTGYKSGVRLKSDGVTEDSNLGYGKTCVLTGFIPVASGDVIRAKNVTFADGYSTTGYVSQLWLYGSTYGKLKNYQYGTAFTPTEVDGIYTFTVPSDVSGVAHMRLQAEVLDGNSIVTKNQEIV